MGSVNIQADEEPKDKKEKEIGVCVGESGLLDKLDRRMCIAAVRCHYSVNNTMAFYQEKLRQTSAKCCGNWSVDCNVFLFKFSWFFKKYGKGLMCTAGRCSTALVVSGAEVRKKGVKAIVYRGA
jgi:hypothetical protein